MQMHRCNNQQISRLMKLVHHGPVHLKTQIWQNIVSDSRNNITADFVAIEGLSRNYLYLLYSYVEAPDKSEFNIFNSNVKLKIQFAE